MCPLRGLPAWDKVAAYPDPLPSVIPLPESLAAQEEEEEEEGIY